MPEASCGFSDVPQGAKGHELLAAYGPTIFADIGFDPHYDPKAGVAPIPGLKSVQALVDTGAARSCVDSLLAAQLGLPIVDTQAIAGVHGVLQVNMHLAQIHVPALEFTIYGVFAGVHLAAGGQPHKALLGRAFLQSCSMVYDGRTGNVVISC